ncbi:hypothetical protein [Leucobacter chromiisoli]|uniref:hypothetical protein n=1 Tax=Leucobacter chromiisoli TaxID=2796471 RepID=UPI001F4444CB|nr:hypothetical protein [Leucobacter chromiisoli]
MHSNEHDPRPRPTAETSEAPPTPPAPSAPLRAGGRLSWPLIAGLSALALLWPLAELTGMPAGFGRAAVILSVTTVCWVGIVGFGRFPRPVLTLTLVGLGSGILSHALALAFGGGPAPIWAVPVSLGLQAGWGALAGLLAWAIQAGLAGRGRR